MKTVDRVLQVVVVFPDLREPIMRINLRGLTMTAVLLSTTASYAAKPQYNAYAGDSEVDYYGEEYTEESYDNESYEKDGAVHQASASSQIGDHQSAAVDRRVRPVAKQQTASYAPQSYAAQSYVPQNYAPAAPQYQQAGFRQHQAMASCDVGCDASYDSGCDGSCGGGCDGSCGMRSGMNRMMCGKSPQTWMQAEALLWFPQSRTAPPLAVVSDPGTTPLVTEPSAILIGNQFGNNLSPGFRADVGRYFGDGNFGIGGRFWILSDDNDSFSLADDGTNFSIGRPFFDAFIGQQNAVLVASQLPGNANDFTGSISGQASLDIIAAEAYARINLGSSRDMHADLIGGYSYFGIDDDLSIQSTSNAISVPGGGTGASTSFSDSFNTSNDFHGGQIGAETVLRRGRWVARSLTKVHLGNMHQQVSISGNSSTTDFAGGPTTVYNQGLLAVNQQGEFERDVYTFAPEVNLKLGYRFRDHVTFSVGYSFIYWNNVALAGQQIDPINDGGNANPANGGFNPPNFAFRDAGFWVQGVDLGATIEF